MACFAPKTSTTPATSASSELEHGILSSGMGQGLDGSAGVSPVPSCPNTDFGAPLVMRVPSRDEKSGSLLASQCSVDDGMWRDIGGKQATIFPSPSTANGTPNRGLGCASRGGSKRIFAVALAGCPPSQHPHEVEGNPGLGVSGVSPPRYKSDTILSYSGAPVSPPFVVRHSASAPKICLDDLACNREEFLVEHALICRFMKVWPKLCDLHSWIDANWKDYLEDEISIYPCTKGFFILEFEAVEDKELVLNTGPWFFHDNFLCMKPWYPSFDPRT